MPASSQDDHTWISTTEFLGSPVGPVFGNVWIACSFHRLHLVTGRLLSCSTSYVQHYTGLRYDGTELQ